MAEECRRICESCKHAAWDCEGNNLEPVNDGWVFDGCDVETRPYFDPFDNEWKCSEYRGYRCE